MNAALELHDTQLESIVEDGDSLRLVLPAYVHRSSGHPGVDAGMGYCQAAELVFSAAQWSSLAPGFSGTVSDGVVRVDGELLPLIPLPFSTTSDVRATLVFTSGVELNISAALMSCRSTGEARFVETFAGSRPES